MLSYIRPFMKLDPHVLNNYNYEVRSLYFDSHFQHSFLEKRDGIAIRKKLRIRYYPNFFKDDQKYAFIEIKKKVNENVAKSRVFVPLKNAVKILECYNGEAQIFYKNASAQDKSTLQEIWFLYKKHNLKPACVVSYQRQPFMSRVEKTFRLTFDTNLKVRKYNFDLLYSGGAKNIVPPNICVMEVKFNNIIPKWAIKILQKNDCVQYKISKFATGLEKTKIFALM